MSSYNPNSLGGWGSHHPPKQNTSPQPNPNSGDVADTKSPSQETSVQNKNANSGDLGDSKNPNQETGVQNKNDNSGDPNKSTGDPINPNSGNGGQVKNVDDLNKDVGDPEITSPVNGGQDKKVKSGLGDSVKGVVNPDATYPKISGNNDTLNSLAECLDKLYPGAQPAFFRRSEFPKDFVFGSATAAFQIEGALDKHCRGHTTWDKFANDHDLFQPYGPDAVNHVEKFEEDVKLMKDIGFDAYRFSISWSRILPCGRGMKSPEGIEFYKNLIKTLKTNGIEPFVTLFHWDLPLDLQDKYHGFLSREIVEDFGNYAKICFEEFGDDVNYWITLNEPYSYAFLAHVNNVHAPAYGTVTDQFYSTTTATTESVTIRGSRVPKHRPSAVDCLKTREKVTVVCPPCAEKFPDPFAFPYIVTHNMLLAHGQAVKEFRSYQRSKIAERENKKIGITLVSMWFEPRNPDCGHDKAAARRALDFFLGWYLDPLVHGEYPESMQLYVKTGHLPEITTTDRELIKGSYDFIGVNYYTARYVGYKVAKEKHLKVGRNYITDQHLKYYETRVFKNGKEAVPIGEKGSSAWLISYPKGIEKLLLHMKNKYMDPVIYITENGLDDKDDGCTKQWSSLGDQKRMIYIRDHLKYLLKAITKGVQVKGYFVWSLLDNFEWDSGFKVRFGLVYVDYKDGSQRYPKLSAQWFKHFLQNAGYYDDPIIKEEEAAPGMEEHDVTEEDNKENDNEEEEFPYPKKY